ncbi:TolC family protein [Rhodohalobacter sp. 614A]|uniref:TolC family protein n=1 Tax=Rhodohalobacter sp. 614A TaxID=2908649 RepID=UPI001F1ADDA3|nr:TolC family protein [Rhodohalobacter sp. 614A]
MKRFLTLLSISAWMFMNVFAQSEMKILSLEKCYDILYTENPVTDKIRMNRQITNLNQRIAQSGWYPDVQLEASASYQSDVVNFPLDMPNLDIPNFSKDHYNIALNITQPIFDGGRTSAAKQLEQDSGEMNEASMESDLLTIKEQVDRVYFGILILQVQMKIHETVISDLEEQLELVKSRVENGVLLPGNESSLRAEILKREQDLTKIHYDIMVGLESLAEILGTDEFLTYKLELPEKENWELQNQDILRPELAMIEARQEFLGTQKNLSDANKLPTVSVFVRPSYGRPGFNMFEDDLQFNWIVGVQARWSLKSARNASVKTDVFDLQQKQLSEDRTLFNRQQNAALNRLKKEIQSIEEQIQKDQEILELLRQVAEEKRSLVDEGSNTVTDYISALNDQYRAELQLELRKIMRVQAIINYETEQGWTWN